MSNNFEIKLLTKDLIHCLNFAAGIVEKRTVRPILGNIKLDVFDSGLFITGTSNDLSIKISLNGEVLSSGTTTVNVITFTEIIRKITDETITLVFDEENEQLIIKGSSFTSNLSTLPSSEFPVLDNNVGAENSFSVSAKKLLRLITCSEFAMSTEETRYNLNGIYLNSTESGTLNSTAIDGHRLSTISEEISAISEFGFIIPRKTVFELFKILKDTNYTDLESSILFDSRRVSFLIGNIQLISKLVDATFPDYKSLLPSENKNKLTTHSKYLLEVVDRVSSITHDKFRAIKFTLSDSQIEISAFGETKGSAKEIIDNSGDVQKFSYEGEEMSIGFNPKYLLDVLKNLNDNEIDILFNTSLDPILIKPALFEKDKYLIMPMKV
jgi:DNA polymerase-3 subunit beta